VNYLKKQDPVTMVGYEDFTKNLLESSQPLLRITGQAGVGKSILARHFVTQFFYRKRENSVVVDCRLVPNFIEFVRRVEEKVTLGGWMEIGNGEEKIL
jgi:hypothetical protein